MTHSIDHHAIGTLDFKQHPVISDPQPVIRSEGRQMLYVARKVIFQLFQRGNDPCRIGFRDSPKILDCPRLQFDFVTHYLIVAMGVLFFKEAEIH